MGLFDNKPNDSSKNLDPNKVIQYRDSNVCILVHMIGRQKEFYAEFSNITKQGYELKSTFAPSTTFIGIGGSPLAICYFQKVESSASSVIPTKQSSQTTGSQVNVRFCKYCGKSNTPEFTKCQNCHNIL